MYRDEEEIKGQFKLFLEELVEIAREDGIITTDEQAIIDSISNDIENLQIQILDVLDSDLEQDEFKDIVEQYTQDMVYNATKIAKADEIITQDESALLDNLEQFANTGVIIKDE